MKKNNPFIKFAFLCIVLTTIVTVGIGVKTKTEAQAQEKIFDWFSRISVKKCAISLEKNSFSWTGEQITPEVRVNYKGTDLVKNVDYVLTYENNVDAGTGTIVVEGKGDYKGKESIDFEIVGIDLEKECIVEMNNSVINVYYQNQLLQKNKDYGIHVQTKSKLIDSMPAANKFVNTYRVTTYYTVYGKGQFSGRIVKTTSYIERLIEDGIYADDYEE